MEENPLTEAEWQRRDTEKWRTIPEFPNYVISSHGRVANKNGTQKMMNKRGAVSLSKSGFKTERSVHQIFKTLWPEAGKYVKAP